MNIKVENIEQLLNELRGATLLAGFLPENIKQLMQKLDEEIKQQELKKEWYLNEYGDICNRKHFDRSYSTVELVEVLNKNVSSESHYTYEHESPSEGLEQFLKKNPA